MLLHSLLISIKSSPLSFSSLAQSDGPVLDSFLSLVHHVYVSAAMCVALAHIQMSASITRLISAMVTTP